MKLLGLSGSLRAASTNTAFLNALAALAPDGFSIEVFDGLGALPLFSPDLEENTPESVLRLAARVEGCDGILIACPEYAHGIPGGFKNALDWLVSRLEIPGKPVMLVHASTRSVFAREQLREVLKTMSCRVFPGDECELHLIKK
ncbi:MAG: NADPH-dependent FMN reductase, partial [Oricola sp.]